MNRNVPLWVLDLVPITSGSTRSRSPPQQRRPVPSGRAPRLSPLLVRRAPPEPRRRRRVAGPRDRHGGRATEHPHRLGRSAARPPHRPLGRGGVRAARRRLSRAARPRSRPIRGARTSAGTARARPAEERGGRPAWRRRPGAPERAAIPSPHRSGPPLAADRRAAKLLQQPNAESPDYGEQMARTSWLLLRGEYRSDEGLEAHAVPGEGADVETGFSAAAAARAPRSAGRLVSASPPTTT